MPKRAVPGETDLATVHPELAKQLVDPSLATQLHAGSTKKVSWRCAAGHEWETQVHIRTNKGGGCPVCAGLTVLPGSNDLATTHPELAKQLVDQTLAIALTAGSHKKVSWRCAAGHEWEALVKSRVEGRGCPVCADYGIQPDEPGVLYVIASSAWLKAGIANTAKLDRRLDEHRRQGLTEVLGVREFPTASEAKAVEDVWKAALKEAPAHMRANKSDIRDGFTETVRRMPRFEQYASSLLNVESVPR